MRIIRLSAFEVQIFDVTPVSTGAIIVNSQAILRLQGVSGSGNAGYGISISSSANIDWAAAYAWNLTGALGDVRFSTAPLTILTAAQTRQPSDYAQKGVTPAMVAGTTTVTVPWYDNVAQRVTVSHAVFGGTPGILSVQQISTTQFVITSSTNLDTSTVNWTISPLGRNIFISTS